MLTTVVVLQPVAAVMEALCEHTCELATQLSSVASARVQGRRITPGGLVICEQRWRARADVPPLLRPHLEDSLLDWQVVLERRLGALECRWRLEPLASASWPLRCHGTLACTPAAGGRGTRIETSCTFAVANEGMRTILGRLLGQHVRGLAEAAARSVAATSRAD
jgi:hypothetical protein